MVRSRVHSGNDLVRNKNNVKNTAEVQIKSYCKMVVFIQYATKYLKN